MQTKHKVCQRGASCCNYIHDGSLKLNITAPAWAGVKPLTRMQNLDLLLGLRQSVSQTNISALLLLPGRRNLSVSLQHHGHTLKATICTFMLYDRKIDSFKRPPTYRGGECGRANTKIRTEWNFKKRARSVRSCLQLFVQLNWGILA